MFLDTHTLFAAATISYLAGAVIMFLMPLLFRAPPTSVRLCWLLWGVALLTSGVGTYLVGLRGTIPNWVSIHLSNILILAGYGLRPNSLTLLTRRKIAHPYLPVIAILGWGILNCIPPLGESVAVRVVYIQTILMFSTSLCLWETRRIWYTMPLSASILVLGFALDLVSRMVFITTQVILQADSFLATFQDASLKISLIMLFLTILIKACGLAAALFEHSHGDFKSQANTDALTGLPNAKAFVARMSRLLASKSTFMPPHALAFFMIDDLPRMTETYGPALRDSLERLVGRTTWENLPEEAISAHLDTNLFAVALPGKRAEVAHELIKRIELCLQVEGKIASEHKLNLTLTAGVISFQPEETLQRITERAEDVLKTAQAVKQKSHPLNRHTAATA